MITLAPADLRAAADRYIGLVNAYDSVAARLLTAGNDTAAGLAKHRADRFMGLAFDADAAADRAEAVQ